MAAQGIDRRTMRKRGVLAAAGAEVAGLPDAPTATRLRRVNAVSATAFVLGGALFALGAALSQGDVGGPRLAAASTSSAASSSRPAPTRRCCRSPTRRAAPTPTASCARRPGAGGRWSRAGSIGRAR